MKLIIDGCALDAAAEALAYASRNLRAVADDRRVLGPALSHGAWRFQVKQLIESLCNEPDPELTANDEGGP